MNLNFKSMGVGFLLDFSGCIIKFFARGLTWQVKRDIISFPGLGSREKIYIPSSQIESFEMDAIVDYRVPMKDFDLTSEVIKKANDEELTRIVKLVVLKKKELIKKEQGNE